VAHVESSKRRKLQPEYISPALTLGLFRLYCFLLSALLTAPPPLSYSPTPMAVATMNPTEPSNSNPSQAAAQNQMTVNGEQVSPEMVRLFHEFMRTFQARQHRQDSQHRRDSDNREHIMRPRVTLVESISTKQFVATFELPGMSRSDVSITARDDELIVSGERRPLVPPDGSGEERTIVNELKYGKFMRVMRLPKGTEPTRISASMDDGLLTVCWPMSASPRGTQNGTVNVA